MIRCLLIVPFPESSLNDEAGKMFMDSYEEFAKRARIMTEVHAISNEDENIAIGKLGSNMDSNDQSEASTGVSGSSSSSSTAAVSNIEGDSKESLALQKKKDAKKKNLKRL